MFKYQIVIFGFRASDSLQINFLPVLFTKIVHRKIKNNSGKNYSVTSKMTSLKVVLEFHGCIFFLSMIIHSRSLYLNFILNIINTVDSLCYIIHIKKNAPNSYYWFYFRLQKLQIIIILQVLFTKILHRKIHNNSEKLYCDIQTDFGKMLSYISVSWWNIFCLCMIIHSTSFRNFILNIINIVDSLIDGFCISKK